MTTLEQMEQDFVKERDATIARLGSVTLVHQFETLLKAVKDARELLLMCTVCPDCGAARGHAHKIGCKFFAWFANLNGIFEL